MEESQRRRKTNKNNLPFPSLVSLHQQPQSVLTMEGNKVEGSENIVGKLRSMKDVPHNVLTADFQLGPNGSTLIVFVTGQLVATGPGQYYLHNTVFRIVVALSAKPQSTHTHTPGVCRNLTAKGNHLCRVVSPPVMLMGMEFPTHSNKRGAIGAVV
eukprot:scaffold735_cov159-Ochromonas_danica.AAC.13